MARIFSNKQKAFIYYREFAQSQLTGKRLWLLDNGCVAINNATVDHIVPYSKGGKTEIDNGRLSGHYDNWLLSNTDKKLVYTENGLPTFLELYLNHFSISKHEQDEIFRFMKMEESDFYFNAALGKLFLACDYEMNPFDENGRKKDRDTAYFMKNALDLLSEWNKNKSQDYKTFEERGLLPRKMEIDQEIMLSFRDVKTETQSYKVMKKLLPYYIQTCKIEDEFTNVYNFIYSCVFENLIEDMYLFDISKNIDLNTKRLLKLLENNKTLPRLKANILETLRFMKKFYSSYEKNRLNNQNER